MVVDEEEVIIEGNSEALSLKVMTSHGQGHFCHVESEAWT